MDINFLKVNSIYSLEFQNCEVSDYCDRILFILIEIYDNDEKWIFNDFV